MRVGGSIVGSRRAPGLEAPSTEQLEERAHVLRRLTFGPFPGGTEASLEAHPDTADAILAMLAAGPLPFVPPADLEQPFKIGEEKVFDEPKLSNAALVEFWIKRMASDEAGLHEKMMWFWHTLITTSGKMGTDLYLWRQLRTLHQHAMGNLRDLARAMVIDPAMMQFLNSDFSAIEAPNENLGRELMELFLMGRGNYTEDDVRAAAQGLAGWSINFTDNVAHLTDTTPMPEVTLLGKTAVYDPDMVVDQVLAQPVVAPYVVRKLWKFFLGGPRDEALIETWADQFRASDYEIAPLVATMVTSDAFLQARHTRPRGGLEWLAPVIRILEPDTSEVGGYYLDSTQIDQLGQLPYFPPNVAGWPDDSEWLSSSTGFSRASYVAWLRTDLDDLGDNRVDAALARCGLYDISDETRTALDNFDAAVQGDARLQSTMLVQAVVLTPEFALA